MLTSGGDLTTAGTLLAWPADRDSARAGTADADAFVRAVAARLCLRTDGPRRGPAVLIARLDRVADALATAPSTGVVFIGIWWSRVYVGPVWRPGSPGCPRCLASRATDRPDAPTGPDSSGSAVPGAGNGSNTAATFPPGTVGLTAVLAAARLGGRWRGAADASGDALVHVVDATTRTVTAESLVPDAGCPVCRGPARDTLPVFTPDHMPLPESAPGAGRVRGLDELADVTGRRYVGARIGFAKTVRHDLQSPFGACSVELQAPWGKREPAIGRAASYRRARTIALLEGLERTAGLFGGLNCAVTRGRYADLADQAVDPRTLGTHPARSYAAPGFRYRPFSSDTEIDWVRAYSLGRRGPVLVPERSVFYGPRPDGWPGFAFETSSGCAIGSTPEEAVLHGIRELAERDAFLLTWYRRLALPEVSLTKLRDRDLRLLLRRAEQATGARFRAFLATMEYGLPSLWLTAELDSAEGPCVLAGGAAHLSAASALRAGLYELVGLVLAARYGHAARRAEATRMLADPDEIRLMADHALVNSLPAARGRFSFLLDADNGELRLDDIPPVAPDGGTDVRALLGELVRRLDSAGLDVLAADQTTPEAAAAGLSCVRVIIPGLVPITFGHAQRRVVGLPRLTDGPPGAPYRSTLEAGAEVGDVPHPFP